MNVIQLLIITSIRSHSDHTIIIPSLNKSDVANRFSHRDFLLASAQVHSVNATVFKLIAIFVLGIIAEIHFRSIEATQTEKYVTN
jgi:hypothetical protein